MKKLSLCMIVKNEEKTLPRALKNAKNYADEIIIVDTGSQDKTKEVAKKFTENIFDFEWNYDFSKARNFSFDKATLEYIMWLDADDILTDDTVKAINAWKESEDDIDVVMCPYVASFDENYKPVFQYLRERIVKNTTALRWHDRVHEVIIPSGKIVNNEEIKIFHGKTKKEKSDRNLLIYRQILKEEGMLSPRGMFYFARELYFNNFIDEAIHEFSRFLADGKGWSENNIEACLNLAKCYQIKKKYTNALTALYGSFMYDTPRSEVLYEIGNVYLAIENYNSAIYWFKQALDFKPSLSNGGFVNMDTCTILPAINLCLCYDKIGNLQEAYHYHEIAKAFNPFDKSVLFNEEYFASLKNKANLK